MKVTRNIDGDFEEIEIEPKEMTFIGSSGDCDKKLYGDWNFATDQAIADYLDYPVEYLDIKRKGTHPGGNAVWVDFFGNQIIRV